MRQMLFAAAALWLCASVASGQEASALINKALDEKVTLILDEKLPAAMDAIWKQTGVRLREDPMIWDLLPYDRETKIQMKIENVRLRDALSILTRKLGLQAVLRDDYLEIQPMPALKRLPQRATLAELQALDLLATRPLQPDNDRPTIRQLLTAIDLKLAKENGLDLAIENQLGEAINQDKSVFVPRTATLMDALECLPKQTKATWYAWGKTIIVRTKEDHTRELLGKPLTIRPGERGIDVLQVLGEISTQTGVPFEYQPGVIQNVSPDNRMVRGIMRNAPARQILEEIAADKGLAYTIQDDRVYIALPTNVPGRDPPVGFIQTGAGVMVLVRESDLTPAQRDFVHQNKTRAINALNEEMRKQGFAPATQPADEAHN